METKWLSIQSFERNQNLMDALNKLLIHLKLTAKGIDDKISKSEINDSRDVILAFLKKLKLILDSAGNDLSVYYPLAGVDDRFRNLIRNFQQARVKKTKFKSKLFTNSINHVIENIESDKRIFDKDNIDSLTELRNLIEEHVSTDLRELIGDI